jgi:SAM-dependent methyltransferase
MESSYIAEEFRRNFVLLAEAGDGTPGPWNAAQASMEEWPIACESVDMLILPHLLEFQADPHRILGEAERVLKPEGWLFVLGFNPWSLPGLLRQRRDAGGAWNGRFIGCFQVIDWLNLLKFEAEFSAGFGFPAPQARLQPRTAWQKSVACLAEAYAVKAVKRTWTPIPIRHAWLNAPELLPGQAIIPPIMRKHER